MLRPRGLLLTLTCLWLMGNLPVHGQPDPADSHQRLPDRIDRALVEKRMAERFHLSAENSPLGLLENLLKNPERYGVHRDDLIKMAREVAKRPADFGIDLKDPKFQRMAAEIAGQAQFRPDQIELLKKIIPDLKPLVDPMGKQPVDPMGKPPLDPMGKPPVDPMGKPPVDPMGKPPFDPMGKPPGVAPGVVQPASHPTSEKRSRSKSWLGRQLEELRNSTGLSGAMRDRFRGMLGSRSLLGNLTRDLSRQTRRLTGSILPSFDVGRINSPMRRLSRLLPDDLRISGPRFSLDAPNLSGGVSAPAPAEMGIMLLGALALALLLAVVFLLARSRGWVGAARGDGWRLGAWPVSPSAVRTRDDVVKAFEYLALLRLGREAGAANHLDIAGRLGADDLAGEQRRAARELAHLYEQARYAPLAESLSESEMETARRDLCYLAGVAAA